MGKNYALNINISSDNYRLHLTTHQKSNPKNALNFCMSLRKRLTGGTIKKIYMHGLERIVYIDFDCYNELNYSEPKTLIIELMGKHSNVILIDEKRTIIDSLRHLSKLDNSVRDILPGAKYLDIENTKTDFASTTFDSFYQKLIDNTGTLSNLISQEYIGLSKFGVQFILNLLAVNDTTSISLDEYKKLYNYIKDLIKSDSCLAVNLGNNFYIKNENISTPYGLNFFIDDFYYNKEIVQSINSTKNNLLSLILSKAQKLKIKLEKVNSTLSECSKMDDYRLYGELITANLYKLNNLHQDTITLENYYNENVPISIKWDASLSPAENAEKYFKKYKKLQNALSISEKQKELVENEISYLDSVIYEITNTNDLTLLNEIRNETHDYLGLTPQSLSENKKSKENSSQLPTEYKIDGYTVYVGKNNKQNDYLTCKMAKNYDLWFHTKDIHGSHVVLRLQKNIEKMPDSVIYKCACIAAFYSKAKMSQNVPVDYTFIKYVKKPNGAKPGMVIYTDNKTLYVNPKNPAEF